MAHFGVLSFKGVGHLNPLIALSKELQARGHQVTFFLPPEFEQPLRQQGLGFFAIDIPSFKPQASPPAEPQRRESSERVQEVQTRLNRIDREIGAYLQAYPPALQSAGVEALIMGEIVLTGPTVAELLQLPYFVVSTTIPHNFGWNAPASIWPPPTREESVLTRRLEVSIFSMKGPVRRRLDRYRQQMGLGPIREMQTSFPERAHITQWPQCLDLPQPSLPNNFFYTGPYVDSSLRTPIPFPWEKLDGRPLIYASLGTTKRAEPALFHRIAEACAGQELQLVITLGGRRDPASLGTLPGDPLVVPNAPQRQLLQRAEIIITHAGPNTVLETLLQGKPMVALPVALDQPAVAARLARLGVAEVLPPDRRSAEDIRAAFLKVRKDPRYREAAQAQQANLIPLRGVALSAGIIEAQFAKAQRREVVAPEAMTVI